MSHVTCDMSCDDSMFPEPIIVNDDNSPYKMFVNHMWYRFETSWTSILCTCETPVRHQWMWDMCHVSCDMWHVHVTLHDMWTWHVTCIMWHVSCDMRHVSSETPVNSRLFSHVALELHMWRNMWKHAIWHVKSHMCLHLWHSSHVTHVTFHMINTVTCDSSHAKHILIPHVSQIHVKIIKCERSLRFTYEFGTSHMWNTCEPHESYLFNQLVLSVFFKGWNWKNTSGTNGLNEKKRIL